MFSSSAPQPTAQLDRAPARAGAIRACERLLAPMMVLVITVLGVSLSALAQSARVSCSAYFAQTPLSASEPNAGGLDRRAESQTIRAIAWLRANADKINPVSDHLEPLVPLVRAFLETVPLELEAKRNESGFAHNAPLVRMALTEIRDRIASRRVTYEFLYGLAFRIGVLFEMRGDLQAGRSQRLHPSREPRAALEHASYATHNRFMTLTGALGEHRRSAWHAWRSGLRAFPRALHLPYPRPLSRREMNWSVAYGVYPVGRIAVPGNFDGGVLDEITFPFHDLQHREQADSPPYWSNQIRPAVVRRVARSVLHGIERDRLRTPEVVVERLHLIHLVVFSEGAEFVYRNAAGEGLDEHSASGLANGIRFTANEQLRLVVPSRAESTPDRRREATQREFTETLLPGEDPHEAWHAAWNNYRARLEVALTTDQAAAR